MNKFMKISFLSIFISLCMLLNSFTCFANRENETKTLSVGDYIVFGKYYEEPILWRVIDLEEDKIMLLSDKILCIKVFDAQAKESDAGYNIEAGNYGSNDWEKSSLRLWLNSDEDKVTFWHTPDKSSLRTDKNTYDKEKGFMTSFTSQEKNSIYAVKHQVTLPQSRKSQSEGGTEGHIFSTDIADTLQNFHKSYYKTVEDKVFLLDVKEVKELLYDRGWGIDSKMTRSAILYDNNGNNASMINHLDTFKGMYWLRTPISTNNSGVRLIMNGSVSNVSAINMGIGVRPALYLKTDIKVSKGNGKLNDPYTLEANGYSIKLNQNDIAQKIKKVEKEEPVKDTTEKIPVFDLEIKYNSNPTLDSMTIKDIIYNNGEYIAVGNKTNSAYQNYACIITSKDGLKWEERLLNLRGTLNSIAYNGNLYIAVGSFLDGHCIITSKDGHIWSMVDYKISNTSLSDIIWSGKHFIASYGNSIIMSSDGQKWNNFSSSLDIILSSLSYGKGLIVGVGHNKNGQGIIVTTPDGASWTKRDAPTGFQLKDIVFNGKQFVASGGGFEAQAVVSSEDGINWIKCNTGSRFYVRKLVCTNEMFVGTGDNGEIILSKNGIGWWYKKLERSHRADNAVLVNDEILSIGRGMILQGKIKEHKNKNITLKIGNPYMDIDGVRKEIYPGEIISPVIYNSRTYLPVRALIEEIGGTIGWNDNERKVTIKAGEKTLEFWIDKTYMYVNGKMQSMGVYPIVNGGRVFLPIRFIIDNLDLDLQWNGETQEIKIVY